GVFPDVWVTVGAWPRLATGGMAKLDIQSRNWGWLGVVGRLESGATRARADSVLTTILRRDAASHGESFEAGDWKLVPTLSAAAGMGQDVSPALLFGILAGAVAAALL